jgi:hypothetical protein
LKLKHGSVNGLGTFEALEFFGVGNSWKTGALARHGGGLLHSIRAYRTLTSLELIARAESQHERVEEQRLACAKAVFRRAGGDRETE